MWLKGITITEPPNLTRALKTTEMGKVQEKRELQAESFNEQYIAKFNSTRKSCIVVFLDALPTDLKDKLKTGIAIYIIQCLKLFSVNVLM